MNNLSKQETTDFLKKSDLFSSLENSILNFLYSKFEYQQFSAGDILMREGDPGDSLYLIQEGEVAIVISDSTGKDIIIAKRCSGESVGEFALLTGEKRTAKAYAKTDSKLLRLSKTTFDNLNKEHPSAYRLISQAIVQRLQQAQLQSILHTSNLFVSFNENSLRDLESKLSIEMINSGQYLVKEGDESDSLHIIISGRIQVVTQQTDSSLTTWAELGRGETIGEMGILTGDKRSASVYALRDTLVAKLSEESFYWLMSLYPNIITKHFCGTIINRLWEQIHAPSKIKNTLSTFAILSNNTNFPIDEFCTSLCHVMSNYGTTLLISSQLLDQKLDKKGIAQTSIDDPSNITLVRWLSEQETQYQYIIYQTDPQLNPWTKRCIRQADRILQVCNTQSIAKKEQLFTYLTKQQYSIERLLVLFHDQSTTYPKNTELWIKEIKAHSHTHIKRNNQQDYARLARMLTGNSTSLVLSGGGARGLAHIGTLKALEQAKLEIDMVGGTSIGAVISAQVAMGLDSQTIFERTKESLSRHNKFQYTLPILSILTGASWKDFIYELFHEIKIEDLWLNYFCCSTNLTDNQLKIHDSGLLWEAVRASSSIPGLIPPFFDRKKMLVDGAIVNNLPVDIMRARNNGGKIYACDVGGGGMKEQFSTNLSLVQSGWPLFFRRNKKDNKIPSISTILMQSATMGSQLMQQTTQQMTDLYIAPDVSQFSLLDFGKITPLMEQGYRCANEQIEEWLKDSSNNL